VGEVFVDAGYLIALRHRRDQHHQEAAEHWRRRVVRPAAGAGAGAGARPRLVTSSFVLDEAVTFLNARGLHREAVRLGRDLLASRLLETVHVDEGLFLRGFELLGARPDQRYSLTDCTSFVLMRDRGIAAALTFDRRHFGAEGFAAEP
jgi:predicted nucleic acid-binding protein